MARKGYETRKDDLTDVGDEWTSDGQDGARVGADRLPAGGLARARTAVDPGASG
jgi:hypothetical protein